MFSILIVFIALQNVKFARIVECLVLHTEHLHYVLAFLDGECALIEVPLTISCRLLALHSLAQTQSTHI